MVSVQFDEMERNLAVLGISEPVSEEESELLFQVFVSAHVLFGLSGEVSGFRVAYFQRELLKEGKNGFGFC